MARAKFTPNRRGIGAMLNSFEMEAAMVILAERVRDAAVGSAAVGPGKDGGHVKDHYKVDSHRDGGAKGDRAEAWVYNDHPAAIPYEVGYLSKAGKPVMGHNTLTDALDVLRGS